MKQLLDAYQESQKRRLLEGSVHDLSGWDEFAFFFFDFSLPALISACATQLNLQKSNFDLLPEETPLLPEESLPCFENRIKRDLFEDLRQEIRKQKKPTSYSRSKP